MQTVSEAYKNSIKGMKRNRGHIRVTIGVVNQLAQYSANAVNSHNNLIYFSMPQANDVFFGNSTIQMYATDEQDFTKVDGSMYFAPDPDFGGTFYKNGIVTNSLLSPVYIEFVGHSDLDIKGLTIDFGECYPTSFTVQTNNTTHTYENDTRYFSTEDIYNGSDYFIITPLTMVNGQGRMRILAMSLGISNIFTDTSVIDFSSKEYVSPITDSVPSRDITTTIDNRNQYYSPDNPESAIAYMEVGQRVTTQFGYDLNESGTSVEWVAETITYLSEWKATDSDATFVSTDKFYSLTGTYSKGLYRVGEGITLYNLALDVLADAGITDDREYYLDPYLKEVKVNNPLPPVNHATALQIIANAGRCVLSESRDGRISLRSSFMPDVTITSNGETEYSHVADIGDGEVKDGYAHDSYKFTPVDGSVFFVPDAAPYLHTGYYSDSIYIAEPIELGQPLPIDAVNIVLSPTAEPQTMTYWSDGQPQVTLTLEAEYSSFGLKIQFREVYPRAFTVETFYENVGVDSKSYTNDNLFFATDDVFQSFDKMVITFTEGAPNARVCIDNITLGEMTDYKIERTQMIDSPTATRQRNIKAITVTRNVYSTSSALNDISSETIAVSSSSTDYDIYLNDPYFDFEAVVNSPSGVTVSIIEQSSYHVKLRFTGISGETQVSYTLKGKIYTISEISVTKPYRDDGEEIVWNNPLVSTTEQAENIAEWLAEFYLGDVQYDITWRGDPRLDANDLMFIELKDRDDALIRSYQNEITYNGAWRGNIQARKVVME